MSEIPDSGRDDLGAAVRAEWNANADFWDGRFGEGNDFQRFLIGPATERLLRLQPGERVLDAACGNGAFSRRMADLGAHVVAFDFSEVFLERARSRSAGYGDRIEYRLIDATNEAQLLSLSEASFDAAVSSMAMMDMVRVEPLLAGVYRLLKPAGRFVFSVMHPCFNNVHTLRQVVEEDRDGEIVDTYSMVVTGYATPTVRRGLGMIGQPVPQHYFHRPLNVLLGACFAAGFVLDGLEEPTFPAPDPTRMMKWENFRDIPPALVARLKRA